MMRRGFSLLLIGALALFFLPSAARSQGRAKAATPVSPLADFLASPFAAAFDPMPAIPRQPLPPGMCRWERYLLDAGGRVLLDGYGRPMKEVMVGPCLAPPN